MSSIGAIVGLGNPGPQYTTTRHNAGWWLVDWLAAQCGVSFSANKRLHSETAQARIGGHSVWLIKPQTFMNRSGQAMRAVCDFYKLDATALLVAHDDLDLPPGTVRMKRGGGHGGHNGLRDAIAHCGADFARLRLGIGHPGHKDQVLSYVLKPAGRDEQIELDRGTERAGNGVLALLESGWDRAVQQLHTKAA